MQIFLTPLVKSEINWFHSCKACQQCISAFDSGWQQVKVLWIFHCLRNEANLVCSPVASFAYPLLLFCLFSNIFSPTRCSFSVSVFLCLFGSCQSFLLFHDCITVHYDSSSSSDSASTCWSARFQRTASISGKSQCDWAGAQIQH